MNPRHHGRTEDGFVHEVRRQVKRARESRELSFWEGLSLVGAVGWMIAIPSVLGAVVGRWLDDRFGSGVLCTLLLLGLGLAAGCLAAFRHAKRDLKV